MKLLALVLLLALPACQQQGVGFTCGAGAKMCDEPVN